MNFDRDRVMAKIEHSALRGEKSADLGQELASQDFAFDGQAAALVVVEQNPLLPDDLPEYLVLRAEVINALSEVIERKIPG